MQWRYRLPRALKRCSAGNCGMRRAEEPGNHGPSACGASAAAWNYRTIS